MQISPADAERNGLRVSIQYVHRHMRGLPERFDFANFVLPARECGGRRPRLVRAVQERQPTVRRLRIVSSRSTFSPLASVLASAKNASTTGLRSGSPLESTCLSDTSDSAGCRLAAATKSARSALSRWRTVSLCSDIKLGARSFERPRRQNQSSATQERPEDFPASGSLAWLGLVQYRVP